jgi:hypothetical protein
MAIKETDEHYLIVEHLKSTQKDWRKILELNNIENFNTCKVDDRGIVRNNKGHVLKGLSLNADGRTKEVVQEDKEAKKILKNDIQVAVQMFLDQYPVQSPTDYLAFARLKQCKTTMDLDEWSKNYFQYYKGKKASEDGEATRRELVITLGNPETTDLFKNLTQKIKPVGEGENGNNSNT